jgi:hypothetical protein
MCGMTTSVTTRAMSAPRRSRIASASPPWIASITVAVPCEDVARHEPDGFLVLDEEHGLRALEPGLLKTSRNAPFCFTAP